MIENRGGAGGTLGASVVAKAPPDGYTLVVNSSVPAKKVPEQESGYRGFDASQIREGVKAAGVKPQ